MGTLRRRGKGYQIDYLDSNGRRVRQQFKKKKEAEAETEEGADDEFKFSSVGEKLASGNGSFARVARTSRERNRKAA